MCVKVSVIIPVYNVEDYLKDCLNSLLSQTLQEFEVICVDDGSTDMSLDILHEYKEKDSRMIVLHQQNQFAGVARNKAIDIARGEYLLFLDADDFFEKDMLEKIYLRGQETKAQIVLFGARQYHQQTREYIEVSTYLRREKLEGKDVFNRHDFPDDILCLTSPAPWTKAFSKDFVINEHLRFQSIPNTNDAFFTITAMAIAERITWIDADFVNYRVGLKNNTQSRKEKHPCCFIDAYKAIYDELKTRGIYTEVERCFVRVALSSTVYCLKTTHHEEAKKQIIQALGEEKYTSMHLLEYPESFYININDYYFVKGQKFILKQSQLLEKNKKIKDCYQIIKKASFTDSCAVSVIIPIYNVEKYLKDCLESIVSQTLKNIQIICIIDGSLDHSIDIVKTFAKQDQRITIINQENMGLSATRNHGVKEAIGEYVYFMDGDDILDSHALKETYEFASNNHLDSVFFDASCFSDDIDSLDENLVNQYHRIGVYPNVCTGIELFQRMCEHDEFKASACLQLMKREHILKHQLCFHEGVLHEDNAFTIMNMILSKKVGYIHKDYFKRRYRHNSIMTKKESFQNVYGYYIAYADLIKQISVFENYSNEEQKPIFDMILRLLTNARDIYARLDKAEKMSYLALDLHEMYHFKILVATPGNIKSELILKQQRLQITFDEKYERGLMIKELRQENKELRRKLNRLKPSTWIRYIKRHI